MPSLRLTASLSVVAVLSGAIVPVCLANTALSQPTLQQQTAPMLISQMSTDSSASGTSSSSPAQTTTGQSTGTTPYASPGTTLQTPGANLPTPGTTQSINGSTSSTGTQTTTGSTQTTINGQPIGPSLPSSTKTPGAEQTFVNGQSTGTTQVAPPITTTGITQTPLNGQSAVNQTAPLGANGTPVGPNSVLYPPQLIQGSGVAPAAQPSSGTATGTLPIQPQATPSTAATRAVVPGSSQPAATQLQPGQGTLDTALQQAICAQNWQQAIQVVNTAIAATPTSEAGYRSQLVAYRSRLQTLQAKGVRAPNWAQQCRGGAVAAQ